MGYSVSKGTKKRVTLKPMIILLCICLVGGIFAATGSANDFIRTFTIRHGGSGLSPADEVILAKFDLIDVHRWLYDDVDGASWAAIKKLNPNAKIFLYQNSRPRVDHDDKGICCIGGIGRYNESRGHSMGDLNTDNKDFYLLDAGGNRIHNPAYTKERVMDYGSKGFRDYWIEATINDIANQKWKADGVFIDVVPFRPVQVSAQPKKYRTSAEWAQTTHQFINDVTAALKPHGQLIWTNTRMKEQFDFDNYVKLDQSDNPPYAMLVEAALATKFGSGDVQFAPESYWKRQVDLLSQIHNIQICYLSHSDLKPGMSGTDNWGNPFTFWDAFWYAMGSYHLGKNTVDNNSYWSFTESYNTPTWYDEFDYIDFGPALGKYSVTPYGGNNIYWREFQNGYVFVNPTRYKVSNISLPTGCVRITRENMKSDPSSLPVINTISLTGHRAAFLMKESFARGEKPPQPPENLRVLPQ